MDKILTQSEIENLLIDLGMKASNARIGGAIALCEAPVDEKSADGQFQADFGAVGDQELANDYWGNSYGGFQIRSLRSQKGTGGIRDEDQLIRPRFNCRSAIAIKRDTGWSAWSTYQSGMYKAYLQDLFPPPANTYIVVRGDSLTSITDAVSNGAWTWEDLARVNNLHYPYMVYIGQYLTLP